jgi:hypothetical protein
MSRTLHTVSHHPFLILEFILTLKQCRTLPKRIQHISLSLHINPDLPQRDTLLVTTRILGKYVLKLLRAKPAFMIIAARITSMLVFMGPSNIYPEERISQPAGECWVAEAGMNDEDGDNGENNTIS